MKKMMFAVLVLFSMNTLASAGASPIEFLVKKLDQVMRENTPKPRNYTIATKAATPLEMIAEYNQSVHRKSSQRNQIVAKERSPEIGHKLGTVSDAEILIRAATPVNQSNSASQGAKIRDVIYELENAGAVLGFDGAGYDNCGNPELYVLVVDTQAKVVYGVETAPCAP